MERMIPIESPAFMGMHFLSILMTDYMKWMKRTLLFIAYILAADASGQTIRVATYNLNWGNRRGGQVIDAIIAANADVLCLQETTRQSERFLKRKLADRYPEFRSAGYKGKYGAERFTIACGTRLRNWKFHRPSAGLFGFCAATFDLGEDKVRIINVHLTPFYMKRRGGFPEAMDALARTEEEHSTEIEAIIRTIKEGQPTIIAGDLNSLSTFRAPKRLAELGFVDAFASANENADAHPTWRWPTRPLPLALRIDYIFHSPHFRTSNSEVIRRDGSDHYLVVAELKRVDKDTPEVSRLQPSDGQ